jgi:hypothetical protein
MASLSIDSLFRYFVPSVFLASLGLRGLDSLFLSSLGLRGLNGLSSIGDAERDGALQRYYGDAELGRDVCSVNRSVSGVGVLDHDAREHSADGAQPRRRDTVHWVISFFLRLSVFVLFSAFGPVKKKTKRKKRKKKRKPRREKKKKKKREKERRKKEKRKKKEKKKKNDDYERAVEAGLDHVGFFVRRFRRDVLYARDDT